MNSAALKLSFPRPLCHSRAGGNPVWARGFRLKAGMTHRGGCGHLTENIHLAIQSSIESKFQEITVAHSLSAKKRIRQDAKRRTTNRARKSQVKTQVKRFEATLEKGDVETAGEQLRLLTKKLDKTAATSTMHKKTAARKKSRLAKKLNALKAKSGQGTSSPSTSP